MIKPAPLKNKIKSMTKDYQQQSSEWTFAFDIEDVAALKLWLESKAKYSPCEIVIDREDWKEGWSDVND